VSVDQRTQAADRLLKAISPGLAAELDRILDETRKAFEADFEQRLQAAVKDAETSARDRAAGERQQAVDRAIEETRNAVRKQVADEMQSQFSKHLDETTGTLKSTHQAELQKVQAAFEKGQADWKTERDQIQAQAEQWRVFAEAQKQLADAGSQTEILMRWLKLAEPFGSSVAVYTAKADGLALWKSRGKAVFPGIISQQTTDPESYFKPIVVRGKTVAAVCSIPPYRADALDFLVSTVERAIELFGLKLRTPAGKAGAPEAARIT
jgi:hypothetical protein